jgi:tetratricopeptide (TPR) repeat protein
MIPEKSEVLFATGTIWRIKSVKLNENPCIIDLISCDELDTQLTLLIDKYTKRDCSLMSLGNILCEFGKDAEAEWFYSKVLEQECLDDKTRGILYYKLGIILCEKEDYHRALDILGKSAHLLEPSHNKVIEIGSPRPLYLYDNTSPLLTIYNNVGLMFQKNKKYDKAVEQYQKALEQKGTNYELVTVHNNLGLLYYAKDDYTAAREYILRAVELINVSYLYWPEVQRNFVVADECFQNLLNKQKVENRAATMDELNRYFDSNECSK